MREIVDDAIKQLENIELEDNAAVVFDVDETALSNYKQTKEIGFGYYREGWDKYIQEGSADVIPQSKRLYDWLVERDVHVIFITGRQYYSYENTYRNLVEQGYSKFDTLICKAKEELKTPSSEYKKSHRKRFSEKGYKIIATFGDQWSDLEGENTGLKFKFPNYLYLVE
jgi:predicted secreted acid phosphatase